jgi:hypothetical protein
MVELDALWRVPRFIRINGKPIRVPFGIDLDPDFVAPIRRWITHSGPQYAAKRVKALKIWAIQILSGNKQYKEPWVSYTIYKGYQVPRLRIFHYLLDNLNNLKKVIKVLIVLNSYKQVTVGEPSLSSIQDVETSPEAQNYINKLRLYVQLPQVPKVVLEPVKSVDTRSKYADDFGVVHPGPYGEIEDDYLRFLGCSVEPTSLGKIVPIPDKGKWRNILVGHHILQLRTKKLADWLRNWLWQLPEIASGDQNKMVDFCIESLKSDRYMLSIDLSEATDRLSRQLQILLLQSMGVPRDYLSFLSLPCYYRDSDFGGSTDELKKTWYANGQPMGLFVSFPMFELTHYVLLKWVIGPYKANFTICGDDCVISCNEEDSRVIYQRYTEIIQRFGGKISLSKTLRSRRAAEGVGALFLKGIQKEIRIPSGKLSTLEARTPGTWLYSEVVGCSAIGRAILSTWLTTSLEKEYTYQQRMKANEFLITRDLSTLSKEALESLCHPDRMPRTYSILDDHYSFWRNTPEEKVEPQYHWISLHAFRDALVSDKIITLYKGDKDV